MKLVCVKCEVELRPEKNSVKVAEMWQNDTKIYKLWESDKWKCPVCGIEICAGFPPYPLFEHYEQDLEKLVEDIKLQGNEVVYDKEKR